MNDRVERVGGIEPERRVADRRRDERDGARPHSESAGSPAQDSGANLPVPVAPVAPAPEPDGRPLAGGFAAFVAQVLGQPGQKRGLKGGPETLEKARATYLETEYSGAADRRPPAGKVTRTDV